ncbi:thiamine pyrophosphate-binding protein [Paraburkholderia guartelaensis]|uniref:Thiamine pyrophosphate-binding protein n=1 Tax=Paraburkholderia guartelaensis TaxID=2546446 RepID=A0A4R5LKP2_9BURK|nr:thiamine pyrophosphate-binding protein [Paraburkholderia guartelaensis]TDG10318.1 thiamine pyrophosphate-binding protein [Paraburkholderia guartelaensis]
MSIACRGADALVKALSKAGVKHVFTLSGNHIMPVFDACIGAGIELFHTRHEAAAVHMADAYARLTGKVGVALVTGGPGHANAVSALYTAQMAESPVLLLSGHAPHDQLGMGAFQEMRQADVAAPLVKMAATAQHPDTLVDELAHAIRTAQSGRPGPVHLSLPVDVLEGAAHVPGEMNAESFLPARQMLDDATARRLVSSLADASRPLILVGPACMTRAGRERTDTLAAALGVPVIGMESPRGINDPALGAFAEVLAQADRVMLIGKRMDFTLAFGKSPAFAPGSMFLQIDPEPQEIARTRRALGERLIGTAVADSFPALEMLATASRNAHKCDERWTRDVQGAMAWRPEQWRTASSSLEKRVHPVQALTPFQALLDSHPDAVFVSDGGEFGQWAQACLRAPNRVINGVAGAIGAALPFALAARVAYPDAPIVSVMGDGTFGFHAAEMDTAVRYGLPFVAVVGNDARWNAEYQIQLRSYGPERLIGCELLPARYDRVTEAFGGAGALVEHVDDMKDAIDRAQAAQNAKLPACVNIMIEGVAAPSFKRRAPEAASSGR